MKVIVGVLRQTKALHPFNQISTIAWPFEWSLVGAARIFDLDRANRNAEVLKNQCELLLLPVQKFSLFYWIRWSIFILRPKSFFQSVCLKQRARESLMHGSIPSQEQLFLDTFFFWLEIYPIQIPHRSSMTTFSSFQ